MHEICSTVYEICMFWAKLPKYADLFDVLSICCFPLHIYISLASSLKHYIKI